MPDVGALTFDVHDALLQRVGPPDPLGVDTGVDLGDQIVDAGRQVIESIVELLEVGRVVMLGIGMGRGDEQRDRQKGGNQ